MVQMKRRLSGYLVDKYNHMTNSYTCNRLMEEAARENIDLRTIGVYDTVLRNDGIYNQGELLPGCDFIINRFKSGKKIVKLRELAVRDYNRGTAYDRYVNKYWQINDLSSTYFQIPDYVLSTTAQDYHHLADGLGIPFVAKGLESSQGDEIYLIQNEMDFQKLKTAYPTEKEWLFETFIESSYGRDIRFFSVRGEVIACMTREASSGFRANVALGASVRSYPVSSEIKAIACDIYRQTELDFLGIDLLFGTEGYVFCEINVMPGIEGMEHATGVNVAQAMIETIKGDFGYE